MILNKPLNLPPGGGVASSLEEILSPYAISLLAANKDIALMQLVGNNSTSGANCDWIAASVFENDVSWGAAGSGYGTAGIRNTLATKGENLQKNVKKYAVPVSREYRYANTEDSISETFSIPSAQEMNFTRADANTVIESKGRCYSTVYNSDSTRIKRNLSGTAKNAWLRSFKTDSFLTDLTANTQARIINTSGAHGTGVGTAGIAIAFNLRRK